MPIHSRFRTLFVVHCAQTPTNRIPALLPPSCNTLFRRLLHSSFPIMRANLDFAMGTFATLPPLIVQLIESPPNHNPPYLTRSRSNLIQFCVPQQPSSRHFIHVAHASHQLDGIKRTLRCSLRRVQDGTGTVLGIWGVAGSRMSGVKSSGNGVRV